MKTLSHLQNEAIKKFRENYENSHAEECNPKVQNGCVCDLAEIEEYWKQQIEKIVKKSFKNTRVEEREMRCLECADSAECECRNNNFSYRLALSDKQEKENQFLNN